MSDDLKPTPEAEHPLAWTAEQPSSSGWYWWRPDSSVPGIVVRLRESGACYRAGTGYYMDVAEMGGFWAGPLNPPAEG